jgi:Uma2 family endonuclease
MASPCRELTRDQPGESFLAVFPRDGYSPRMPSSSQPPNPDVVDDEDEIPRPDVSNLITEDDTPVDNLFSEKQMRLLTEPLHASWNPGFPFVVMANVAVYVALNRPAIVPDVLLTTQVEPLPEILEKDHRSYFSWLYEGRAPEVVIEIVSNKKGNELTTKKRSYEHMGVIWYAVHDPMLLLSDEKLKIFCLQGGKYVPQPAAQILGEVGLGLTLWEGEFENTTCSWLRWHTPDGKLVQTGKERGDAEAARAAKLAAKLRELGIDPASID